MRLEHPHVQRDTTPPGAVTIDGETYTLDDGVVQLPDSSGSKLLNAWANRFDVDPDALRQSDSDAETCDVIKNDGEVCGRELPCPYHSDDTED